MRFYKRLFVSQRCFAPSVASKRLYTTGAIWSEKGVNSANSVESYTCHMLHTCVITCNRRCSPVDAPKRRPSSARGKASGTPKQPPGTIGGVDAGKTPPTALIMCPYARAGRDEQHRGRRPSFPDARRTPRPLVYSWARCFRAAKA